MCFLCLLWLMPSEKLARATGLWIPTGRVSLFPEMRAADQRTSEILRIVNDAFDDQPLFARRLFDDIEVFGHRHISAIRNPVFLQISGPHARRDHFQGTARPPAACRPFPI